ncbi:30S ribosomal protein S20 [Salinisphaera sp.]|uniref:30S ribosomal protein S20 n=1 Tax=Salinisphaera sp. TaxID=1914330 RepID=UPI002D77BD4E|nr:30S ribosomal protein S20 [Salinisphaera sp.]HET7314732.1 30S ribosomal protein S20 [Salinisphaera sp.]
MANTAQARKRVRQATKHRQRNMAQRSLVRTHIKKVQKAIGANDLPGAQEAFKNAVPIIDRMAGKGQIHRNKAARHKSRLNAQIKAMAQATG